MVPSSHLSLLPLSDQLFQASRSPARDMQKQRGAKVIIAKPGSYHRPARGGHVIGGHRYWTQGQSDLAHLRVETRSGRSPRRHSPGNRKIDQTSTQLPGNSSGLLGVSFSKLNTLKHLRARGAVPQKTAPQNNKAAR